MWEAGADVETRIDIELEDGSMRTFGEDSLLSMSADYNLFPLGNPSVGNAAASELDVELLLPDVTFRRMGKMRPYVRLISGTDTSEWIPKGVFYIDTRTITKSDTPTIKLHGFDSMMKAEQIYGTAADEKTMRQIVADIAQKIGVTFIDQLLISNVWKCQVDTSLTMREYLQIIAAANCGNFTFDYNGNLKLIKFTHLPDRPVIEYLADESANRILFGGTSIVLSRTIAEGVHYVGSAMQRFDYAPTFQPYSKVAVIVKEDNGQQTVYEAGNDSGRELEVYCVYGTQAIANYILQQVSGFAYQPIESGFTILDPSAELGDGIFGNDIYTGVYGMSTSFDRMCVSTVSAPADEEIDHEYEFSNDTTKMERKIAKANASLQVLADEIKLKVDSETVSSMIDQKVDSISLSVTSADGTSSFVIKAGETVISTQTLKLNVDAAEITGTLTANQIDASQLHVAWANIDNVEIESAQIKSIAADQITAGTISAAVILGGNSGFNWAGGGGAYGLAYPATLPVVGTGGGVTGMSAGALGVTGVFAVSGNSFFPSGGQVYIGDKSLTAYIKDTVGTVVAKFG